MNQTLSRRSVLKAGALAGASLTIRWSIPGLPPSHDVAAIPAIPLDVERVTMQYGGVIAVEPNVWPELKDYAYDRLRRGIATAVESPPNGWVPEKIVSERTYEVAPGGDHGDPVATHYLVGVKQTWQMVRA